jgi:glyoxylase-like metal-dependent hydrolase (beta-lactamase superfamily II)
VAARCLGGLSLRRRSTAIADGWRRCRWPERSKREYARNVEALCDWLAEVDNEGWGGDPLGDPLARDYAARDFKRFLKVERGLRPASVNLALASLDSLYRCLGLGSPNGVPVATARWVAPLACPVRVLRTPAHAPGHLSLWQPDERLLVVGDALSDYDVGWVNRALDGPGAAATALASLQRLADLAPRVLLPSHGPIPADPDAASATALRRPAPRQRPGPG